MRVAVVTDDLIQNGGQERVTEVLLELFPDCMLFSSIISPDWKTKLKAKNQRFTESLARYLPFATKLTRYYAPFLVHNLAYESFNFNSYDLVISSSSRFAHHIVTKPTTIHICYLHSPGRMFWLTHDYFRSETYGLLNPLKKLAKPFLSFFLLYQRMLDFTAAQRVDYFIANSTVAKSRIQKYYGRPSTVIWPFIEVDKYKNLNRTEGDYFLVISRLVSWKKIDIAIKACLDLNLKLKIIGQGPDRNRLLNISKGSSLIEFMGGVTDSEKLELLANCNAVIQTQFEDFGLVPLEANAAGKPVIAYGSGGVLDSMVPNVSCQFFGEQTSESLKQVLVGFDNKKYDINECIKNAERFDKSVFKQNMLNYINNSFSAAL